MTLLRQLIIGLLLLTVACRDQQPGTPPSSPPAVESPSTPRPGTQELTACNLLSPEDIEFVLGEPVPDRNLVENECTFYRPPDADGLRIPAVRLQLEFSSDTPEAVIERYEMTVRDRRNNVYEPIPLEELGEVAAWDPQDEVLTVALRSGGRTAFVLVQPMDIEAVRVQPVARALTEQALERL